MESTFDMIPFLADSAGLMQKKQADALLERNGETAAHGLRLTPQQALALAQTQTVTLRKTGRIELGDGVAPKLAAAFCDSPYVTKENYEETLHELIELFYGFKNETYDVVGDDALIGYMKRAFDGECRGSLELLSGSVLPALARKLNERRAAHMLQAGENA